MNEEDRKIFARNLRYYMRRDKITGIALAKYMGVSSATVSDWMNAKKMPRVDKLKSLSHFFHIDMTDLTEDKDYYVEIPEILQRYNELNEENQIKLLDRAIELVMLQRMETYNKKFQRLFNSKKGEKDVGTGT